MFTSVIANLAGNPKKPVRPDKLYTPNLTRKSRERFRTPEEEKVWQQRILKQYEDLVNKEVSPDA